LLNWFLTNLSQSGGWGMIKFFLSNPEKTLMVLEKSSKFNNNLHDIVNLGLIKTGAYLATDNNSHSVGGTAISIEVWGQHTCPFIRSKIVVQFCKKPLTVIA
jgi:hypothetical protein